MGQSLTKFIAGIAGPIAVADALKAQDPKELAIDCATGLKKAVIAQVGVKAYGKLRNSLIPWLDAFYVAFRKVLHED